MSQLCTKKRLSVYIKKVALYFLEQLPTPDKDIKRRQGWQMQT